VALVVLHLRVLRFTYYETNRCHSMKRTLLAIAVAAVLTGIAAAQNPETITIESVNGPTLTLLHPAGTYTTGTTIGNLQFMEGLDPVSENYSYNLGHLAHWRWIRHNYNETGENVMTLRETGVLKLIHADSGINGLTFSPGTASVPPSISFANATDSLVLQRSGTTLTIGGATVLTQTLGDGRYPKLGVGNSATGFHAYALGFENVASAPHAIAMGVANDSSGVAAVALGSANITSGAGAYSLGAMNTAAGNYSGSLGLQNQIAANSEAAFVAGRGNQTSAPYSFVFGYENKIPNYWAWEAGAFGQQNEIRGALSMAMGDRNFIDAYNSFVGGRFNFVSQYSGVSFTHGMGLQALGSNQFVVGRYNAYEFESQYQKPQPQDAIFIVGNGHQESGGQIRSIYENLPPTYTPPTETTAGYMTDPAGTQRSNAFVVRGNGNAEVTGNVIGKSTTGLNKFKAPVLVPQSGDISMGEFTAGTNPNE
jgi:hypothetical protein